MLPVDPAAHFAASQPVIERRVVDLEQAIFRLKELKEQRHRSRLETARLFAQIRQAYPDVPGKHRATIYSPQLRRAAEEAGYSVRSLSTYFWLHANPEYKDTHGQRTGAAKKKIYTSLLAVIEAGATLEDVKSAIKEELDGLA